MTLRRGYLRRAALGLLWVLLLLAQAAGLYTTDVLERLETWAYDVRLRASAAPDADPAVVIIDLDERSLQTVGRWPWPRHRVAELVTELLDRQGAALVAFDVLFAEADESSGLPVLRTLADRQLRDQPGFRVALEALEPELDRDAVFARTIAGRPVILGYYFIPGPDAFRSGQLPRPLFVAEEFEDHRIRSAAADGYAANIPQLQDAARGAGHINPLFDRDGLTRRVPLLVEFEGGYYESLSLAAARLYLGGIAVQAVFGAARDSGFNAIEALRVGEHHIPVDAGLGALVPYRGPQRSFPYLSAADLLEGRTAPGSLAGRIVLVGSSAPGLMDLRATPAGSAFPGVEIHANLIAGILDGTIKARPAYLLGLEVLNLLVFGGALALLLPLLGPAASVGLAGTLLALTATASIMAWDRFDIVMPTASLAIAITGVFALHIVYGLFVESRARNRIAGLFGQYVPPRVVEALAARPETASMAGETRTMTVLFADVRDFTTISESLPAAELAHLMNAYLTEMTQVIQQHDGTIDKYMGDAIMAFWGAPLPSATHAHDAILTALLMQQRAALLRREFETRGWPALTIGIGINTGPMTVGNMGSSFRRAYTVVGDAVNLGARLESLTKHYGIPVLVGEQTVVTTGEDVVYREIDKIRVKGKDQPVRVYEPLGLGASTAQRTAAQAQLVPDAAILARGVALDAMLGAYRAQQWGAARKHLDELEREGEYPSLVSLYRERIRRYLEETPPPDWDGAFTFASK